MKKNRNKYGIFADLVANIEICAANFQTFEKVSLYDLTAEQNRQKAVFLDLLQKFGTELHDLAKQCAPVAADNWKEAVILQYRKNMYRYGMSVLGLAFSDMVEKATDARIMWLIENGYDHEQGAKAFFLNEWPDPWDRVPRYLTEGKTTEQLNELSQKVEQEQRESVPA